MTRRERVTKIIDGDTFETASRKHPVRLANVDAPEKGQKGYAQAKEDLKNLIDGKEVTIETVGRSYGRPVANVKADGKSVNRAMKTKLE